MNMNAKDGKKFSKCLALLIYKLRWLNDPDQRKRAILRPTIGFSLGNTCKLEFTQVHYKSRHALTCHIISCVRRRLQNILMMKMHLMRLFPITFSTNSKRFRSCSPRITSWRPAKIAKGFPDSNKLGLTHFKFISVDPRYKLSPYKKTCKIHDLHF